MSFPVGGTLLAYLDAGGQVGLAELHLNNHLLQIIDLAPWVLGAFSYYLGVGADKRMMTEHALQMETAKREQVQREYAEELKRQNQDLRELNETLDGLVYTASHDLKTPVINFISMLRMLRMVMAMPGSEAKIEEIIVRMEAATDRFQLTINDLLEVSRVERLEVQTDATVHLQPVMKGILDGLASYVEANQATFDIDLPQDHVAGAASGYASIFQNLFTNAIKYRDPARAPHVVVRSKQAGGRLQVTVQDNGAGIDLERHGEKLFKMFTRFHSSADGTGIGLYIVKRTVEKLGGAISVASRVHEGTTFTLDLPQPTNTTS